jgi:hypothetical protein
MLRNAVKPHNASHQPQTNRVAIGLRLHAFVM